MQRIDTTNNYNNNQLEDVIIKEMETDLLKLSLLIDDTFFQKYVKQQSVKSFIKNERFTIK